MFQVWEWCATTSCFFKMIFYVIVLYILEPCLTNHQNLPTDILPRFSISILLNSKHSLVWIAIFLRIAASYLKSVGSWAISPKNTNMGLMIVPKCDYINIVKRYIAETTNQNNQIALQHDVARQPLWAQFFLPIVDASAIIGIFVCISLHSKSIGNVIHSSKVGENCSSLYKKVRIIPRIITELQR